MKLNIHLHQNFDKRYAPIPATRYRDWWEDNHKTNSHARHCLPLVMANSVGYYILSPGTFMVKWDGNFQSKAEIIDIEKSSHYEVDNHATFGGFVVQPKFIPVTSNPGEFVYIKGIPNERGMPYNCMEAMIEAWWSVGDFGLVFLLNQPGQFIISAGQPIAQMLVYGGAYGASELQIQEKLPIGYAEWAKRRHRPAYIKDLDYHRGKTPAGNDVGTHLTNWKDAGKFK